MPRRRYYYEPFIQEPDQEQDAVELRGIAVEHTGTYLLFNDVIAAIRRFAELSQSQKSQETYETLLELATWIESGGAQ